MTQKEKNWSKFTQRIRVRPEIKEWAEKAKDEGQSVAAFIDSILMNIMGESNLNFK